MIAITASEKKTILERYPHIHIVRTMKQDSKRHHYFCTESEELMRPIAGSNSAAAELVREFDRQRALCEARRKSQCGER